MNALIIFAHPNNASFNAALLEQMKDLLQARHWQVNVSNLYEENFEARLGLQELADSFEGKINTEVKLQQNLVATADLLVFIHPVWWYGPPAIMKGWLDRVLTHDFAFEFDESKGIKGLLAEKKALVIETAASPQIALNKLDYHSMLPASMAFCGITDCQVKTLYEVGSASDEVRGEYLQSLEELLN